MESLSLFELNNLVKQVLDLNLAPTYWVVAEIGEMRLTQKGHCYMELVEKKGEIIKAKSKANIWSYTYRNLSGWFESITKQSLQPGLKILAQVEVNFHELYGFSLTVKDIDPNFTLGERARKKQEVIAQLEDDGVLDMNKEIPLPLVPQNIAVISSETAAGYGDFIDQLNNNKYHYKFNVKLFKALMQGEKAKDAIINAMYLIHKAIESFEVVVIIRGGGSQVDLDCFDTYDLAAHIAQFTIPVITGIGHERDETIADIVAHTKLKTPTAVAEFLINGLESFEGKLDNLFNNIWHYSNEYLSGQNNNLDLLKNQLIYGTKQSLHHANNTIDHLTEKAQNNPKIFLEKAHAKIDLLEKSVALLDPINVLKRGYSITKINGKVLKKQKLKTGDLLETETLGSLIKSKVERVENRE